MKTSMKQIQKQEFEARMFISLAIVFIFCMLSLPAFRGGDNNFQLFFQWFGIYAPIIRSFGFLIVAFLLVMASMLRMWAGTDLTSNRVMAFKVQKDKLVTGGAFAIVRHPIYLADFIAYFAITLVLRPIALLLPIFIYVHYRQLVAYEERNLEAQFGEAYLNYKKNTPRRFFPTWNQIANWKKQVSKLLISKDGFQHNAQYSLLALGFVFATFTGNLVHALLIGLPAIAYWATVHTIKGVKKDPTAPTSDLPLGQSKVFKDVLYAQCWEDPNIDRKAFQISPDDTVFTITSGGCNSLAFLLDDPQKVVALDMNPAQNYLLDLKMAAFKVLTYEHLLEFFGVLPSFRRLEFYVQLRPLLQENAQHFWDKHYKEIDKGIIHCGRYERYMHLLKRGFNLMMGKKLIKDLYAAKSSAERLQLYNNHWNNWKWKLFTRVFLSRQAMSLLFTKSFFTYLEDDFSFGDHFREMIRRCVTELPIKDSNFFSYMILGNYYSLDHLPVYLRAENFATISARLDRIELRNESCEAYFSTLPDNSISKFNFTNIFEWMPPKAFEDLLKETIRVAKDGAVLTYRNLLVPRSRPDSLAQSIQPKPALSKALHETDLSFIYKAYIVENISKSHTEIKEVKEPYSEPLLN